MTDYLALAKQSLDGAARLMDDVESMSHEEHQATMAAQANLVAAAQTAVLIDIAEKLHADSEKAAGLVQETVAYRIASKLNTLSTERAQADDTDGSRIFTQAAKVAAAYAKGDR